MSCELKLLGEEIHREIIMMQEALILKTNQLEETRQKLKTEIIEHQLLKNCLDKKIKEMDDLKIQSNMNLKAINKIEEENNKYRETLSKLQTQMDAYLAERGLLIDRCHNAEVSNCELKTQIADLKDKVEEYAVYKKGCEQYKLSISKLIDQILSKQENLNKEQARLEKSVKDGLSLATRLSEELGIQALFVKEANITRIRLEEETVRLLGVLEEERREKRKLLEERGRESEKYYLDDWKKSQQHTNKRLKYLTDENTKLHIEIQTLKQQMDI